MTILIIEDQTMIRELLVLACSQALPFAEINAAGHGSAALTTCQNHPPGLVILDLVLADRDALDLLDEIFVAAPRAQVIALSAHIDEFTLHRALRSRVHSIIDKTEPLKILHEAIAAVLDGRKFISPRVQQLHASVRADPVAFDKILSDREQEVLRLIGEGLTNGQIAALLGISLCTAKHHRANVMAKLDLHSTPKLIHYAIEKGFTRVSEFGSGLFLAAK